MREQIGCWNKRGEHRDARHYSMKDRRFLRAIAQQTRHEKASVFCGNGRETAEFQALHAIFASI
jgi:hypothetical protein